MPYLLANYCTLWLCFRESGRGSLFLSVAVTRNTVILFTSCFLCTLICRPLTHEEITARREQARQRHAEMMANNASLENGTLLILESEGEDKKPSKSTDTGDRQKVETEVPKSHFLAFARVYSGTLKKGQKLYVLGPKHDPQVSLSQEVASIPGQELTSTDR